MSLQSVLISGAVPFAGRAQPVEPRLRHQMIGHVAREIAALLGMVSHAPSSAASRRSSTDAAVQVDEAQSSHKLPDLVQSSLTGSTAAAPCLTTKAGRPCDCRPCTHPADRPTTDKERVRPRAYTDSAAMRGSYGCLAHKVHRVSAEFEALLMKRLSELKAAADGRQPADDVEEDVVRQTGALLRQIADDLQDTLNKERKDRGGCDNAPLLAALDAVCAQLTPHRCLWAGIALHICVTVARKLP